MRPVSLMLYGCAICEAKKLQISQDIYLGSEKIYDHNYNNAKPLALRHIKLRIKLVLLTI